MDIHTKQLLADRGLSQTSVRLALLKALADNPHSEVLDIYHSVQSQLSTVSKQAIYNNLDTLVSYNIVREFKPRGGNSLYEIDSQDNHHHLVCRNCRSVVDTDCLDKAPCLSATDNKGFVIDEAEITFWGLCPECKSHQ